jgi:hypothetical protein
MRATGSQQWRAQRCREGGILAPTVAAEVEAVSVVERVLETWRWRIDEILLLPSNAW